MNYKLRTNKAFTLVEMMIAMIISIIVILSIAMGMADGFRGWRLMQERVNGELVQDAYAARAAFDAAVRKSSMMRSYRSGDYGSLPYKRRLWPEQKFPL